MATESAATRQKNTCWNKNAEITPVTPSAPRPKITTPRFVTMSFLMRNAEINETIGETMPVADSLVEFCATPRTRDEIVAFVGKSKNYVMSQIVAPLVANGKLKMTMPDKPKSSNQKFVKA